MPETISGRPPYRADHVGSLLRPARLRHAWRDHAAGRLSDEAFTQITDESIRDVVALQERAGLQVVNDGEFRRGSYWLRFVQKTAGMGIRPAVFKFRDEQDNVVEFTAPHVEGRIRRSGPITVDEYRFAKSLTDVGVKVTMPSPSTLHFWRGTHFAEPGVYESDEAFFADLAAVFREELADLYAAGGRYAQFDEVPLAMLCDPDIRDKVRAQGGDPQRLVSLYIDAINAAVAERPSDLAIGVHMCRGNFKGKYLSEGGYGDVAERLFQDAKVDHFLLEYDTERAGDFSPLRFVPKDKGVVLGIVSSKVPQLESVDFLRARIDDATRHIDVAQLGISPQCGFASTVAGNPVSEDDEFAKLARCVEVARAVWGDAGAGR